MTQILAVSGHVSDRSHTALLVEYAIDRLSANGFDAAHLAVRDLPAEELLRGRVEAPEISAAIDAVALADGVIVATPVRQASYSGLLKTFLDLLPRSALAGKTVLPLVTSATVAHLLAIDYALRPVLAALGARHVVAGCFLLDRDVERLPRGGARVRPECRAHLADVVDDFVDALPVRTTVPA
ncbi:NADPH-dependent FMN reductase [Streptomyces sp. SM12]|uniref:NADPH-dependent FMN reductase n=1 Tax=Streptomyces sp. SM12 TaxID=1071602 RepID=UPI000CD56FB0|nr:NADPH-dependent FMN reductase [Streptomyces sp. SM12]